MSLGFRMLHMLAHIQYAVASCHVLDILDLNCSLHLKYPFVLVLDMVRFGLIQMEPLQYPEITHSPSVDLFLSQSVVILNLVRLSLAHLRSSARH